MAKKKQEKYSIRKNYTLGPLDMRPAANARTNSAFAIRQSNVYRGGSDALLVRPGREVVISDIAPSGSVGPKNGLFGYGDEIIFAETSSLYKLSPVGITAAYTPSTPAPPGGVTLLAEETFETGLFASWWTGITKDASVYAPYTLNEPIMSLEAHGGTKSANYYLKSSATYEQQPLRLDLYGAGLTAKLGTIYEIFVDWWEYYSTGYPWSAGSQKMARMGYIDANEPGTPVDSVNEDWSCEMIVYAANTYSQISFFKSKPGGPDGGVMPDGSPGFDAFYYNTPVDTGRWINWGWHLKLASTTGGTDGIFKLYMDRNLLMGGTGLSSGVNLSRPINTFWIGGNISGAVYPGNGGNRFIDDIKIYNTVPY